MTTENEPPALADAIREAYHAPIKDKTERMRHAAELVVDLRLAIEDPLGRSMEYRQAIGDALDEADVQPHDRIRFLNALRYHVSNVMRERLEVQELINLGLRPEDALHRSRERRDKARTELMKARRWAKAGTLISLKVSKGLKDKEAVRAQLLKMLSDLDASN